MLQQLLPCFNYKIKLSFEGEIHYHSLRVTLRVFAPSREFVELCAASVPGLVEHGFGRKAVERVDR